jgi:hypothetical protein
MKTKRWVTGLLMLAIAATVWIPCIHFFFTGKPDAFRHPAALSLKAQQLSARQLQNWTEPGLRERELGQMRASNAEWDFMGRTFLVWSLAEMGLRNPAARDKYLQVMDQIIGETLRLEQERGMYFFLMPYAKGRPYVMQPARSHFLDGEIAMMLASRRLVEEKSSYRVLLEERVNTMVERMERGPVLSCESYPDECWMFDNVASLVAIRMADCLDHTDHSAFLRRWLNLAKQKLVDAKTGILISSYTVSGQPLDGPEGSSIWMVAHCLRVLDEGFAQDQYQRARRELGRQLAGFAWSREWPKSWNGPMDIDSGPIVPVFEISAGASGMAFIGASSFGDEAYLSALAATLDFSAFPSTSEGRLKYCASNQVGDAALLYATVLGPLWEKIKRGEKL